MLFLNYKKGLFPNILFAGGLIIGIIALGSVQGYINLQHFGHYSLDVNTSIAFGSDGLYAAQFSSGIRLTEYETYLKPSVDAQYPRAALEFGDRAGQALLAKEGITGDQPFSVLFHLVLKYPLDFMAMYVRHFINMLNPVFGGAYITDIFRPKLLLSILNYILLFIIGVNLRNYIQGRKKSPHMTFKKTLENMNTPKVASVLFIAILLLPCLFILPGQVESRFFFPMYMILYCIFAFVVNFKKVWHTIKSHPLTHILLFIIIYLCLCSVWSTTYASTMEGVYIPLF